MRQAQRRVRRDPAFSHADFVDAPGRHVDVPNQVLARHEILEHLARSLSSPFDRSVDVLVARLRRKIEADPKRPQIIETVRGVGYVLNAQVESVGSGTGGEK